LRLEAVLVTHLADSAANRPDFCLRFRENSFRIHFCLFFGWLRRLRAGVFVKKQAGLRSGWERSGQPETNLGKRG
jgi:hypothetical protein